MTVPCAQCGAELSEGDPFCRNCGAPQTPPVSAAPPARFCLNCGGPLDPGSTFCTLCGARADEPAAPAPAAMPVATLPAPVAPQPGVAGGPPSTVSAAPTAPLSAAARGAGDTAAKEPAQPKKSGNLFLKIVVAIVGLFVFIGALLVGSCVYVGYKVKKKADQVQTALKTSDLGKVAKPPEETPTAPGAGKDNSDAEAVARAHAAAVALPGMGDESERTVGGPEADLLVRVGAVNNLGFGWPKDFDPFSGRSTPAHAYPWAPPPGSPAGLKRILFGSALTPNDPLSKGSDGYSRILGSCSSGSGKPGGEPCKARQDSMPVPITLAVGDLPAKVQAVILQMFVDDFQAPVLRSHFQVSLNGTRIPPFEDAINSLDQSGPIGKLLSLNLLPEYWPLLQSGSVALLIDDPTTHAADGYAIDFARILVNPHGFKYQVALEASVVDADKHSPIAGATVAAALSTATTGHSGHCTLQGLPAGLVTAMASAPGYDQSSVPVDLVAGQTGKAQFQLHRHQESTAALEKAIAETGSANVYGIHFDTDSAKLRPDSAPALAAILGLMKNHPGSRWIIAGHTDNQGGAEHNEMLSKARAASVVAWLKAHEVAENRLVPQGFGASRPVADNATDNGRALNRRVEIAPAK